MTTGTIVSQDAMRHASFLQGAAWLGGFILLVLAIYVSGTKPIGISADIRNYELLYNVSAINNWLTILKGSDVGYFALAKLAAAAGWSFDFFAFTLAAATCILLLLVAVRTGTNRVILICIYVSYLFWLHEYTQIRIAAAIAIGLFAIYAARPAVRWPLLFVGILIHNSFVIAVTVYALLKARRLDVVFVLAITGIILTISPLGGALLQRVVAYQDLASTTGQFTEINIFSLMPITQIAGVACALVHFKGLNIQAKEETLLSIVGVLCFYLLSSMPVLAFRTFELFMPFFVILLSRLWGISVVGRGIIIVWMMLGIRSAFLTADSVVIL